jgi:sugar lactone lactonase YvrE
VLPILQTLSTIISFAQLVPADVDVRPDGTLTGSRVLLDMASADPGVPDGLKVDVHGNVFCTGPGGV